MLPALWSRGRACLWGERTDIAPPKGSHLETPNTHLLPTHGFKHLLKLDAQLLDVVHQDAGLEWWDGDGSQHQQMWLEQLPIAPVPSHPALGDTRTAMVQSPCLAAFRGLPSDRD